MTNIIYRLGLGLGIMNSPRPTLNARFTERVIHYRGVAQTVLVPLLLVTHAIAFRIVLRPERVAIRHG